MTAEPTSDASSTKSVEQEHRASEETPLLQRNSTKDPKHGLRNTSVVLKVLLTGFLITLSFSVTQVPLIYVFGVMTCEEYYQTHTSPPASWGNRCRVREIEASTAQSVALLGASTSLFGVMNLFFTGWTMKAFGIKRALMLSVGFPAARLAVQNIGVQVGAGLGIVIIQASQIITILGGPTGYLLALNSFATEVVEPAGRTAILGRLSGCTMFGTAIGYLVGGYLGDWFGIIMPFRVTLVLFMVSFTYVAIALPNICQADSSKTATKSLSVFLDPLKMFVPTKWELREGQVVTEYGVLLLGTGVFLGVLATSYIPVLLQMYSTDIFDFGTKENGFLISLNSLVRGIFLTFAFPMIIAKGRQWLHRKESARQIKAISTDCAASEAAVSPAQVAAMPDTLDVVQEPAESYDPVVNEESFEFDLWFTKYSLIVDGLLTGLASFTSEGWQMYLIAVILPLASGTGPAAKGTILQMCPASQRSDALSAISLVELVARMTSTACFGLIFSMFASVGRPNLTFTCNAAVAVIGFVFLMFARFPPKGSTRHLGFVGSHEDPDRIDSESRTD